MSFNLFQDQGYCIIRNFIDESKINYLKDKYSDKNNLKYYSAKKLANQSLLSSSTAKILNQNEIFKFLQIKKLL